MLVSSSNKQWIKSMTSQIIIRADITKANKDTLGFEYATRLVRGKFLWGTGNYLASFTTPDAPEPKVFDSEEEALEFIKVLRKHSKTEKRMTIIEYSVEVK
jgi:hypothetical protein